MEDYHSEQEYSTEITPISSNGKARKAFMLLRYFVKDSFISDPTATQYKNLLGILPSLAYTKVQFYTLDMFREITRTLKKHSNAQSIANEIFKEFMQGKFIENMYPLRGIVWGGIDISCLNKPSKENTNPEAQNAYFPFTAQTIYDLKTHKNLSDNKKTY